MARARSRRVQAQRKFAQGAYVPPNVVAVAAADNRRDAAQDPRNVTVHNMTATGLLDVVSLQSAASSPERNGHSHLTSQPVVIVERLRGKNLARNAVPPPSQSETVETRPWEYPHERVNNNVATIKKPAETPKLQTVKKKKEYKREHPMSLRSRRPSKLELNKLIAESCAPLRKVGSKRKKNSSDEDEPLIFQKTRLKQKAEQLSTPKQTAVKESAPKENTPKPSSPKENTPKPSSPKEKSSNMKPCKKRSKTIKEITTNEITTHETTTKETTKSESTTKETTTSESTTKKIITNENSLKETDRRNAKQSVARKKTPMKRAPQKRFHRKCSPKQPAHIAPEFSVPEIPLPEFPIPDFLITAIKEDLTHGTAVEDDNKDQNTPDESVIVVVPNNPLSPDVLDDLVAPVVPVATNDPVIPPVPVMQDDLVAPVVPVATDDPVIPHVPVMQNVSSVPMELGIEERLKGDQTPESLEDVLSSLDDVFREEGIGYSGNNYDNHDHDRHDPSYHDDDESMDNDEHPEFPNKITVFLHIVPIPKNHAPEGGPHSKPFILHHVPMVNDDVPEVPNDVPVILHDVPIVNDNVPKVPDDVPVILHDAPMVKDDVPEDTDDVPVLLYDPPMGNDDVPEDTDDVRTILHDEPMVNGDVPQGIDDPDIPLNKSTMMFEDDVMVQEDVMDLPIMKLRKVSPEPAMDLQLKVYNSRSDEYDSVFCDHSMYLGRVADEPIRKEIVKNSAANLERAADVQVEVPMPCVAAEYRSDKDVVNASQKLLDSRCKVCKPCIRINKLMKVSALLESQIGLASKARQNKAAVLENKPTEREGEAEDVEITIINEDANSTNEDPGNIYLLLPNQSTMMMKLRANNVHGKEVLGVGLIKKNESLINKEFSLEEHEPLLDQIIETLTIGRDVNLDGRDVNLDGQDVNLEVRDVKLEVRDVNSEGRNDNTEGRSVNLEEQNDISKSRRISISSDSTAGMSDATTDDQETPTRLRAEKRRLKRGAVKKKLAMMHERMREEKEREIARVEEEKRREILRLTAEKNIAVAEVSRYQERFTQMDKEKLRNYALLEEQIREDVISKIEAERRMFTEVDGMAANLDKEKDAKKMDLEELSDHDAPGTSSSLLPKDGGLLVEAPVYYPSEEDFCDLLGYYDKIWPEAVRFGICKVVPPPGWKPPFQVHDEMRFDVTNQYISRLFNRWGPAARELCAIKLSLAQQKVNFTRPPLLDGVEVNLPKLYHLVQRHGGLETVYNKKRWGKVAEDMKFNKGPNTERKLDQIYVKYLLPYDTLSHQERQDIMRKVEIAWNRKNQKLLDRALNPLNRQKRLLGLMDSSDDETEDEDTVAAVNEAEDCIIKGAVMNRAKFKKIATMTYENTFGQGSEAADPPDLAKIEEYYWRLVTMGTEHVCVHTAAIDTGEEGYGFTKNKSDSYGRHPWNPKMVSQNPRNVLQYLGPVLGVTVPTLLLGMLFSTSCWHKDPHIVSWLELQLLGPERIWYGIPAHQADNFRKAVETLCPTSCQNKFHWLPTDITMIPPNLLREHNVTLSRVTQRDGEYILAFPNAYTCCISTGYTESESVYFAPPSWLENLWTVFKEARESCEPTMFAMEHLLYNIGKDPKAEPTILKIAQPLFDKMLREEVTNRQMLQERGLPFFQELLSANSSRKKNTANPSNPRDQDECEYCRATLYLSKVKGLTGRNTVVCLEHALKLLDTEKHKDTDVDQLQVLVHVSVKELNTVHDDMKRRLGIPIA